MTATPDSPSLTVRLVTAAETLLIEPEATGSARADGTEPSQHTTVRAHGSADGAAGVPGRPLRDVPRPVRARAAEDTVGVAGAVVSSLAVTWLLYTQLLPVSGGLGFVLCWFALFVAFYTGLAALNQPRPYIADRLATALVTGGAAVVGLALAATVIFTLAKGFPAYRHLNFFVKTMAGVRPGAPLSQGGIGHALAGTAIEVAIAVAVSLPLGLVTAIYIGEVGGRLARTVRTVVEAMTALPDLVAGLFIYTVLVIGLHTQKDGLAASLAIAITMTPIIARSAEVVLRVVPGGLREASYALGASQARTVWGVVLPTARPGLATALILGIARGIGETAPVLITTGASTFLNTDPTNGPMNSLPLFIFTAVRSPDPTFITRGYGAASVLLGLVLVLFFCVRLIARGKATR